LVGPYPTPRRRGLATLYGLDLAEIEHEAADEMASALNRRIHSASLKRPNP
jgi:hypothetical protein